MGPDFDPTLTKSMKINADPVAPTAVTQSAFGRYRLIGEIGRGGMASVFLAVFSNSDGTARPAVLKQLHPNLAVDRDFRAMFEDEARIAMRLHHENVVQTYDVYSNPTLCVLLMEFLDGQTLGCVRRTAHRMGNLPVPLQLHCLAQVLAGLDYVHELADPQGNPLRVVHRDVTPSNVFITYRGEIKVLDFGIAKASTRVAETRVGVLKGKTAYMSPEAVRGDPVDRRSDIFSVGVMMWEALTGRRLWQDHDDVAVLQRLASGDLPLRPPGLLVSDPAAFAIAERALATDPAQRYATAAEMRRDIEVLLARQGSIVGPSALAGYMQSCFGEERQRLQTLVDEAMASVRRQAPPPPAFLSDDLVEDVVELEVTEPPTTVSLPPAPFFRTVTFPGLRAEPRRTAVHWQGWLLTAGALALAASAAFMAHTPRTVTADRSPPVASARVVAVAGVVSPSAPIAFAESAASPPLAGSTAAPAVSEPVAAPIVVTDLDVAPPSVTVTFSARPAEARFSLDGQRLDGNPVTLQRQPDQKLHRLRVEAPGFIAYSRSFHLDDDMSRAFDLVRKPPPAPATHAPHADEAPANSGCPKSRQKQEASESSETPR